MKKIRVLIIDEYPAVCQALAARLGSAPSLEVVGALSAVPDGLATVRAAHPDVILLELKSRVRHDVTSWKVIPELVSTNHGGIIVLTSYLDENERREALAAGARRYLLKDIDTLRLIAEIETVAGETSPPFLAPHSGVVFS